MANQRQRLARKRYREGHPDLFPPPPAPKDPSEKKEKKEQKLKERALKAKRWIAKKKRDKTSGSTAALRKHPLRVPGMRPGESCFICKSAEHIAKLCPQKNQWEKNKICLLCRQRGHTLKNCPEKTDNNDKKFCYNCGEAGMLFLNARNLFKMLVFFANAGGTKFASCFICKERGHLSKNCPKNTHGMYPKGGSCKICGEVTHLAKHCPNKGKQDMATSTRYNSLAKSDQSEQVLRNIHRSGDDLEDDFMEEDLMGGKTDANSNSKLDSRTEMDKAKKFKEKPKKKQGPKVVNFLG